MRYPSSHTHGSVLIIVLWSLFFLCALALALDSYIRPRLTLAGRLFHKTRMHYYAEAGIIKAMLQFEKDDTAGYDSLDEGWSENISGSLDGGSFKVEFVDEERKININKATQEVLMNLFEIVAGSDSQEAERIADAVLDWRDGDDDVRDSGAEDGYYSMMRPGYDCKNRDFEVIEELLLLKDMTPEIFDKVKDMVTVYSMGGVNVNTADSAALQCLGMDAELAAKVISARGATLTADGETADAESESAKGLFESPNAIASKLGEIEELSTEEINVLNRIYSKGLFAVHSDNFMGRSVGSVEGRTDRATITFMYNRAERRIKLWKES